MFTRARTTMGAVAITAITAGALVLSGATAASADAWTSYRRTVTLDGYGATIAAAVDPVGQAAYAVALSSDGAGTDAIVRIDGATGAKTKFYGIPAIEYVMDVAADPDQRLLYVLSYVFDAPTQLVTGRVTVLNVDTAAVVTTIDDASLTDPVKMTIDPQTHDGYVLDAGLDTPSSIITIDGTTHTVKSTFSDASLVNSADLAINPVNHLLYVTNDGSTDTPAVAASVSVIDPVAKNVVAAIHGSLTFPYRVIADPSTGRVYVANSPDYIDQPNGDVTAVPGNILEIDPTTNAILRTLSSDLIESPVGIAVDAATDTLLVTGGGEFAPSQPELVAVDLATGTASSAAAYPGNVSTRDIILDAASRTVWTVDDVFDGAPSLSILDLKPKPASARISAPDRFSNAIEIAKAAFPTTAPVVYVATGLNYPDALGAGAAAAFKGGPLLLTTSTALPAGVAAEIQSLHPNKIVVVGGPNSVSEDVLAALRDIAPTERQGGADRYEASRNIVAGAFQHSTMAFIATGANFPDALSATSPAASLGAPVILIPGTAPSVDPKTLALLQTLGVTDITITGGPNSVSPAIESQLKTAYGAAHVTRLGGADRFEASALVSTHFFGTATQAYLATGSTFPDALAGGVLAATKSAPLLVVRGDCIPASSVAALQGWGATKVILLGGPASLTPTVSALRQCS